MLAIYTLTGSILGAAIYFYTGNAIFIRTRAQARGAMLEIQNGWVFWAIAGGLVSALITIILGTGARSLEIISMLAIVSALSIIDLKIRKITNELLLAIVAIKACFLIYNSDIQQFKYSLIGLVAGIAIFLLPSFLKINIGTGDIKYGGAAGFYLGVTGLFQAIAIMSLVLGIYAIYLLVTKKGGLKTKTPMGPAFSAGFFITVVFPIVSQHF